MKTNYRSWTENLPKTMPICFFNVYDTSSSWCLMTELVWIFVLAMDECTSDKPLHCTLEFERESWVGAGWACSGQQYRTLSLFGLFQNRNILYFSTRLKKSKVRYQSPMLGICSFPFSESPTSYPFMNSFHQTDETVMKSLLVWFSIENVIWGVGEQPSNKKNGPPKLQTSSLQKLWPRLDIPSRL